MLALLELLVVRQRLRETLLEHAIVERLADARRFAGHVPGHGVTLPLAITISIQGHCSATYWVSTHPSLSPDIATSENRASHRRYDRSGGLGLFARTRFVKAKPRSFRDVAGMHQNERIVVDYQCIGDGRDRHSV
ncbi:hypothetical protein QP185_21120 [Sphingomonas aerolata]|uniref:hypothetical protein n=1 Tax=Sphingomonas TaxID=13687 RepID=UPI001785FCDE|nr:hypothetical protein [Sphingomonas sp. CFBP 8764]MBD8551986.1 hypothetical protein [Sphingomonas sp. CFBP 8764]